MNSDARANGERSAHYSDAVRSADVETVLILRLSGETFGIPVGLVHEIIDPIPITRVPNASAFAPGLINVRGGVVALLDIRQRLCMAAATDI